MTKIQTTVMNHGGTIIDGAVFVGVRLCWALFSIGAITYFLFQKKLLPKEISRYAAKALFYPTFPITALLRFGNYWTHIDDTLVLGCAPLQILGHPQALYKMGVRGVINMCDEYGGPQRSYDSVGIKQLRLITVDHFEPTLSQMQEAVKFISFYRSKGEQVYLHCKAGHGRAASIALCWLLSKNPQLNAQDGNILLSSKRKVRKTLFKQTNIKAFYESLVREREDGSVDKTTTTSATAAAVKDGNNCIDKQTN
eukprot:gene9645-20046_t